MKPKKKVTWLATYSMITVHGYIVTVLFYVCVGKMKLIMMLQTIFCYQNCRLWIRWTVRFKIYKDLYSWPQDLWPAVGPSDKFEHTGNLSNLLPSIGHAAS